MEKFFNFYNLLPHASPLPPHFFFRWWNCYFLSKALLVCKITKSCKVNKTAVINRCSKRLNSHYWSHSFKNRSSCCRKSHFEDSSLECFPGVGRRTSPDISHWPHHFKFRSAFPVLHTKTSFTRVRYQIHVVTTSISASLRSYLLSPFFLWLAVIKFCNIIVNLRATCRDHADPVPCKRGPKQKLFWW